MPADKRYVLDTNTVVSAVLLPGSVPRQAFDKALTAGHLVASQSTLQELDEVLRRPAFEKYIREEERLHFLVGLLREIFVVPVTEHVTACRDPKDNQYLELAVSAAATCIISGDQDLLVLHPFRDIPILTPRQFLDGDL